MTPSDTTENGLKAKVCPEPDDSETCGSLLQSLCIALSRTCAMSKGDLNQDLMSDPAGLLIVVRYKSPLKRGECDILRNYVENGGCLLLMLHEKITEHVLSSINYFLETFGISANSDGVIRTSFLEGYFHPKEAVVDQSFSSNLLPADSKIAYIQGCTLNTEPPAVAAATTGVSCYPYGRPIVAVANWGKGRICAIGSNEMFTEKYMHAEHNESFLLSLVKVVTKDDLPLQSLQSPVRDYRYISNLSSMSKHPFMCWQDFLGDVSNDLDDLVEMKLFDGGSSLCSEVEKTYKLLGIEKRQMNGLIKPAFESPPWKLIPVFPLPPLEYILRPPPLELIDIDELLEPPLIRLNRLANKYDQSGDAVGFVKEASLILSLPGGLSVKEILKHVLEKLLT